MLGVCAVLEAQCNPREPSLHSLDGGSGYAGQGTSQGDATFEKGVAVDQQARLLIVVAAGAGALAAVADGPEPRYIWAIWGRNTNRRARAT